MVGSAIYYEEISPEKRQKVTSDFLINLHLADTKRPTLSGVGHSCIADIRSLYEWPIFTIKTMWGHK
jgi:hypothetical protein